MKVFSLLVPTSNNNLNFSFVLLFFQNCFSYNFKHIWCFIVIYVMNNMYNKTRKTISPHYSLW